MRNKEDYFSNDYGKKNGGAAFNYNLQPNDQKKVQNYSRYDRKVNFDGENQYNYIPPQRDEKTATERMYENQGRQTGLGRKKFRCPSKQSANDGNGGYNPGK